jgi:hypothetical protein
MSLCFRARAHALEKRVYRILLRRIFIPLGAHLANGLGARDLRPHF